MTRPTFSNPAFAAIVPNDQAFFVLGVLTGDDGSPACAIKYPVVAWALEMETLAPSPVTLEGLQPDNCYLLQPDGTVERPGIDGFSSVDHWLAEQQRLHATRARPR